MVHRPGDEGVGRKGQPSGGGPDPQGQTAAGRLGARPTPDRRSDFFVLTGASGGGKSTLLDALAARGFTVVNEPGRRIVEEQLAAGGDATPWRDRTAFRDLLFARSLAAFEETADRPGPVFFDRSIVEALAYSRLLGLPVPAAWQHVVEGCRYATTVFAVPPWRAIFRTDSARRKTWEDVMMDYRCTIEAYRMAGYDPIEVPPAPVAERVEFVLNRTGIDPQPASDDR